MFNKIESKKVFDDPSITLGLYIRKVAETAHQHGYKFFLFNDIVYVIDGDSLYSTAMRGKDII